MDGIIIANAQAAAATPAPGPPDDRAARQAELSNPQNPTGIYSKDEAARQAALVELRAVIAAQETPEEQNARANMTVEERREEYGVQPPSLPKPWADEYASDFAPWEVPHYDVAHEHGLASDQVRGLRDAAVDLGQVVGDTGRPASDEDLKSIFDKHKVSRSARPALVKLWREIEGGDS